MSGQSFPLGLRSEDAIHALVGACGGDCAFLRHNREEISRTENSDWDIAVKDVSKVGEILEELFGPPMTKIERLYVVQRFYTWGQVDLLPDFLVNGCRYLDQEPFWQDVVWGDDGIPRPSLAHDAYLAWMTGVLTGGRYNERYDTFIRAAVDTEASAFRQCVDSSLGKAWGRIVWEWAHGGVAGKAAEHYMELRRAVAWRHGRKEPGDLLWNVFKHWWCELKHHIKPPMPFIALLGPDGTGKSSVIDGLRSSFVDMRIHTKLLHWRPGLFFKKQDDEGPVTDPHGKPPRGFIASIAKLVLFFADWWVASLGVLLHARAKVTMVISDRYYNDLLADPMRYRFGAPMWIARIVFKLMPRPDRVIVLVGDPDVIHARKKEVTMDELVRQTDAYRSLARSLGSKAIIIDAGAELESVVKAAVDVVEGALMARAEKRGK